MLESVHPAFEHQPHNPPSGKSLDWMRKSAQLGFIPSTGLRANPHQTTRQVPRRIFSAGPTPKPSPIRGLSGEDCKMATSWRSIPSGEDTRAQFRPKSLWKQAVCSCICVWPLFSHKTRRVTENHSNEAWARIILSRIECIS